MKTVCRVLFTTSLILRAACTVKLALAPTAPPPQATLLPTASPQPPAAAPSVIFSPRPTQTSQPKATVARITTVTWTEISTLSPDKAWSSFRGDHFRTNLRNATYTSRRL
jgi:hypothetical protein